MSSAKPKFTYEVRKFMQKAKKKGRGGDTDIVHVNEHEKKVLKALGGAGTINPATGLKEYKYGGAGVTEGMNSKEGTFSGGGLGGGTGNGQTGMSKSLLDSKYPGSGKKKNRQYEASLSNLAKAGTIVGSLVGGPVGTVVGGISTGLDAINGELDPLDPFSGRMADVPSVGAGYAENNDKDNSYVPGGKKPKKKGLKPSSPLGSYGKILAGVGGKLTPGGL